jgi:hypothetical protein
MELAQKEKSTNARDGLEFFWRFRLRYKELTGCRAPRAPSCVTACAELFAQFGETRVFAALEQWVRVHEDAEDLAEDVNRPGDFLLEDAQEMLRAAETIPRFTLLDSPSSWPPAALGLSCGADVPQSVPGVSSPVQFGAARSVSESGRARQAFESSQLDAVRFPLFACEIRKGILEK